MATHSHTLLPHLAPHDDVTRLTVVRPGGGANVEAMRDVVQRLDTVPATRAACDLPPAGGVDAGRWRGLALVTGSIS